MKTLSVIVCQSSEPIRTKKYWFRQPIDSIYYVKFDKNWWLQRRCRILGCLSKFNTSLACKSIYTFFVASESEKCIKNILYIFRRSSPQQNVSPVKHGSFYMKLSNSLRSPEVSWNHQDHLRSSDIICDHPTECITRNTEPLRKK